MVGVVPYYDAYFGSVETGLGPVVHTPRLTSCQCSIGLGLVRVVHTMMLTSGWLRLVWTSGRSGTYYEANFGSAETGLGPVELYSL